MLRDRTVSWVRIVNGINKYVFETSEEITFASVETRGTAGKPVEKAQPRPKPTLPVSPVSIPYRERKWMDVDPGKFSQGCFEVSKFMIRLLRHDDTVHREDDGAVSFDDLAEKFKAKFDGTSQWPIEAWITFLAKGGGPKKRFQYCLNPNSSQHFLYFRATQGYSGGTLFDPTLQDHVLLPDDFADYIYYIGNAHDMHSIIQGGLIPGGKSLKRDRQSVFFTAVNAMYANQDLEEVRYDLDKLRIAVYNHTWRVHHNTVYWCNLKLAQRKGLQFYQTRSHAIALFNKLPAICIEKVVFVRTGEELHCKVCPSPRLPRAVLTPHSRNGRQNPPNPDARKTTTIKANTARSTRTLVARISKKISEACTGGHVAVTLITEFQAYLTQPSRKKTRIARNPSKD